jgi:hypothetical protein
VLRSSRHRGSSPLPIDLQVVGFYGHTEAVDDDQGGLRARWVPGEVVRGEPSHTLVPGTALPGGRPSTSRPEFLSDDDSALTRFEDEAQVFGYLTGRLNDSADRPGQQSRP